MSDCIEHQGARDRKGYGRVGRHKLAHRAKWEEAHGAIPEGMVVMHTCDNPPCINLDHLRLGTVADNNADKVEKGRHSWTEGEQHPMSKLTEDDVRAIRSSSDTGPQLARRYGLHKNNIYSIRSGRTWGWLK